MSISDQLRQAIEESGVSANSLARATGISQPTISRLLRGNDVKLSIADRLAAHLGLALAAVPKADTAPRRRKRK